ncbi:MAG: ParB/RepB/Spo0J family partition protein [Clostridiales bacterium]|nr:ParB/RepB/Spo0J family partition protein [Clostridiales bacterium]
MPATSGAGCRFAITLCRSMGGGTEIAMLKKALGKGLNALLPAAAAGEGEQTAVSSIDINKIEPNTEQPRRHFDDDSLQQLSESIKSVGIVQPIVVTDEGDYFKIVAGERRWRAARLAGLASVPAIVRSMTREQSLEVALIENLQRQDLNPVEEALGYSRLMSEYGYTQERLSQAIGKSRPAVANSLRLLKLPERVQGLIRQGRLSAGHARAILSVERDSRRELLADEIMSKDLSVRQTELLVGNDEQLGAIFAAGGDSDDSDGDGSQPAGGEAGGGERKGPQGAAGERAAVLGKIEDLLKTRFDTNVRLSLKGKGKAGRIVFEYYGEDDLQRLLDKFGLPDI